ncbi:Uncharacterised protein [Segatella copri]|nr:Uncharacterised protein [Segatella copri]
MHCRVPGILLPASWLLSWRDRARLPPRLPTAGKRSRRRVTGCWISDRSEVQLPRIGEASLLNYLLRQRLFLNLFLLKDSFLQKSYCCSLLL